MQQALADSLKSRPGAWLITGSAGFIGSNLLEALLRARQWVVSLDNFATGHRRNLEQVRAAVGEAAWERHRFIEGDIADIDVCRHACEGVDLVLHQAALGSVPRSIKDPLLTHRANATGFLNMLVAAKDAGVSRFVYAASSSTYGDSPTLPKVEDVIGRPLSPYAVTKYLNELYADVFGRCYELPTIGLRYFNVFGARQDPEGAYAAVIPRWVAAMMGGRPCVINGDGQTSRDFCYIENVVLANLLAALDARFACRRSGLQRRGRAAHHLAGVARAPRQRAARAPPGSGGVARRALLSFVQATCATRWPTSPRRARCSATNRRTTCARVCAKPLAGTLTT